MSISCKWYSRLGGWLRKEEDNWSLVSMEGTYLITYSMEQGPSWEANWFAASQEIPCVLWSPKVPHRTHKRPPPEDPS
jgi:hypothetical protein